MIFSCCHYHLELLEAGSKAIEHNEGQEGLIKVITGKN